MAGENVEWHGSELRRMATAWAAYGAAAGVADGLAWLSDGPVRIVLLVPAVGLSLVFAWFTFFVLALGGALGWAMLTAAHPAIGAAAFGAGIGVLWAVPWMLAGASRTTSVLSGAMLALLMAVAFASLVRRHQRP